MFEFQTGVILMLKVIVNRHDWRHDLLAVGAKHRRGFLGFEAVLDCIVL